jgi:hypothetical protein
MWTHPTHRPPRNSVRVLMSEHHPFLREQQEIVLSSASGFFHLKASIFIDFLLKRPLKITPRDSMAFIVRGGRKLRDIEYCKCSF